MLEKKGREREWMCMWVSERVSEWKKGEKLHLDTQQKRDGNVVPFYSVLLLDPLTHSFPLFHSVNVLLLRGYSVVGGRGWEGKGKHHFSASESKGRWRGQWERESPLPVYKRTPKVNTTQPKCPPSITRETKSTVVLVMGKHGHSNTSCSCLWSSLLLIPSFLSLPPFSFACSLRLPHRSRRKQILLLIRWQWVRQQESLTM